MFLIKVSRRILFVCFLMAAATLGATAFAQGAEQPTQRDTKNDEINLDTQLYLLIATNREVDDAKLPANLEGVVKQLRASLPFKNYRLAATLINRVKNEGRLNLQWVGGPLLASAAASAQTPSFNEFKVNQVRLMTDANGRDVVRMDGFRFGARIPIQTGTAIASNGPAAPIINYENTGLNTDISMHEGEPVIVGTLNVGPSGDAIILVMTARRSSK
ncbi:MAG: hypothetical protein WAL47_04585 [Pyrinomonadaceae bacterium]